MSTRTDDSETAEDDLDKPTERLDDHALEIRLKKWIKQDARASSKWRREAFLDFAFEAGDQWSADDRAVLREQMRPCVSFNRVKPTVSAVTGMEVGNRQEVRYIPRTQEDGGVTEMYTEAARWVRDESDAEDEESDMFSDDVICGLGFSETRVDYDQDPDGYICIDRLDPLECYADSNSVKRNLADGRRITHAKRMDKAAAKEMFPDAEDDELNADWLLSAAQDDKEDEDHPGKNYDFPDSKKLDEQDQVVIARIQWMEMITSYKVMNPASGQPEDVDAKTFKALAANLKKAGLRMPPNHKVRKRHYREAFIGKSLLEVKDAPSQEDFTIQCVTGYRDRNTRSWFGLVRLMRDPQQWANKFLSTIMHQISSSGKGIMLEEGAVEDMNKFNAAWSKPDAPVIVAMGAISSGKILPKPPHVMPQGLPQLLEFAVSSIRDVTGVNLEVLGLADRTQAASLEAQRKQAATTMLASFFDSLRRYRKRQGRVLLDMIRRYIPEQTLIRVVGDDGAKYVPLVKSDEATKYDIIVDDMPSSPNQKEYTWAALSQIMPQLLKMNLPMKAWGILLKSSPVPESQIEKLMKALEEDAQAKAQQPSPEQMQAQAEMAALQAKTEADKVKAQGDMAKQQAAAQQAAQQHQFDMAKLAAEVETAQALGQLKLEQAQAQMLMERERFAHELQMQEFEVKKAELSIQAAKVTAKAKSASMSSNGAAGHA